MMTSIAGGLNTGIWLCAVVLGATGSAIIVTVAASLLCAGVKCIKALTYSEACKVIGELEGRQGTPPPRKSGKPLRKTAPGHTSEGQRRKVWALMYRLQDASPSKAPLGDRLCAIIKKELGMDAFPKDPFAWIGYKDGNKLVEVLKGYVKTAQKSRGDADG